MFDFSALKAQTRQIVHDTLAVQAFYRVGAGAEIETRARWHNKIVMVADLNDGAGYAQSIQGPEKVVMAPVDIDGVAFTPVRGATLRFPGYGNETLRLDSKEPKDGPLTQTWVCIRLGAS